ncbi:uncharacterized protein [Argopecten irradians]|uniref:uncharacterized protein isoform X3 n=1 Tax=Argopecten irradians TaxID=31199 RepID=UPI00371ECBA1
MSHFMNSANLRVYKNRTKIDYMYVPIQNIDVGFFRRRRYSAFLLRVSITATTSQLLQKFHNRPSIRQPVPVMSWNFFNRSYSRQSWWSDIWDPIANDNRQDIRHGYTIPQKSLRTQIRQDIVKAYAPSQERRQIKTRQYTPNVYISPQRRRQTNIRQDIVKAYAPSQKRRQKKKRPESRRTIPRLPVDKDPISKDYHDQRHSDYRLSSGYDHDEDYYNRPEPRRTILRFDRDPIRNLSTSYNRPHSRWTKQCELFNEDPISNMRTETKEKHIPQQKVQNMVTNPIRDLPPLTAKVHDSIFRKKVLRINHIGIWRFGENDFFTSVSKTWNVAQCIKHVKDFLRLRCDVDLWVKNQCTFLEKEKSLSDYAGLTKLFVVQRPKGRDPGARYKSQEPDVTDPYWEGDCVSMSCGHAVVPENLFEYYWHAIKSGNIEVKCPYVPDGNNKRCEGIWELNEVSVLACLTADERLLFLNVLFTNWLDRNKNVYLCPQCDEAIIATCQNYFMCYYCGQRDENNTFCRRCLQLVIPPWMMCKNSECQKSLEQTKSLLSTCQERIIVNVRGCPVVRACPKCQCIIEFDDSDLCKHMTCPNRTCRTRFCFICLSIQNNTRHWPCGSAFAPCTPAPRQKVNIHLPL